MLTGHELGQYLSDFQRSHQHNGTLADNHIYRVGVIGGGRQGTVEARAFVLHPSTEVVAVADSDAENRALFQDRFGVPGYGTYDEMLKREQPDIVLAALPVKANADAVVAAARAGVKAVFCEKPLAGSLEDADRMVEECGSRGVLLGAGLMASGHPDLPESLRARRGGRDRTDQQDQPLRRQRPGRLSRQPPTSI